MSKTHNPMQLVEETVTFFSIPFLEKVLVKNILLNVIEAMTFIKTYFWFQGQMVKLTQVWIS